ncbi:hypothetical protein N7465_006538 [Penicillium sp. CMV-2018d]|nr:hypothetical protein N7465_006538 [Penicillium sp. CMV-2018d]
MNKLLIGGNGVIKAVIIIKWTRQGNSTVGGILELYRNDRQGIPKLEQREAIFPAPTIPPPQAPPQLRQQGQADFNHTTMAAADEATAKHGTSGVCQSIGRSYGSGFANACGEPGQPSKPTP